MPGSKDTEYTLGWLMLQVIVCMKALAVMVTFSALLLKHQLRQWR